MSEQINKDKLNELLGIQEGQSFDEYMGEALTPMDETQSVIDQTTKMLEETRSKVDEIDQQFKTDIQTIDREGTSLQMAAQRDSDGSASERIDSLVNVENAFKSIEDLVDSTKMMIQNVYSIISSCDVLDSETVSAAASLIGETRQLLSEYTSLYKQRVKFFDSVKMEMLKQQHRIELLKIKEQIEKEKWERQNSTPANAEVVQGQSGNLPPGMVEAGSIDMLKLLEDMDKEDDEEDGDGKDEQ